MDCTSGFRVNTSLIEWMEARESVHTATFVDLGVMVFKASRMPNSSPVWMVVEVGVKST